MIIATRNRIIHGYLGIDDDTLWSIIQDDIPELLDQLQGFPGREAFELDPDHMNKEQD